MSDLSKLKVNNIERGYRSTDESHISQLFALRSLVSRAAICAITTEDDKFLLKHRICGDYHAFMLTKVLLDSPDTIRSSLVDEYHLKQVLGKNALELAEIADIDFLGEYRISEPRGRQLVLPYAIDLEPQSTELPIAPHRKLTWIDFTYVEEMLRSNKIVKQSMLNTYRLSTDILDGHYILKLYLDTLKDI